MWPVFAVSAVTSGVQEMCSSSLACGKDAALWNAALILDHIAANTSVFTATALIAPVSCSEWRGLGLATDENNGVCRVAQRTVIDEDGQ